MENEEEYFAIYARVSTEDQAKHGYSLDGQISKCKMYYELYGDRLGESDDKIAKYTVKTFTEHESGKSLNRDKMQEIIADVKKGICKGIVILKLDRLSRNVKDTVELMELFDECGARLCSVYEHLDSTHAFGRYFIRSMANIAQLEREQIVERTEDGQEVLWNKGKVLSRPPYGYEAVKKTVDGKIKVIRWEFHPEESKVIRKLFRLFDKGQNLSQLSRKFDMSRQAIRDRLSNETYLGKRKFKGEVAEGDPNFHKAMISEELFNRVQKRLNS